MICCFTTFKYGNLIKFNYTQTSCKCSFCFVIYQGNENGEPVIAERQIRIMDKPLGHRDVDDGR